MYSAFGCPPIWFEPNTQSEAAAAQRPELATSYIPPELRQRRRRRRCFRRTRARKRQRHWRRELAPCTSSISSSSNPRLSGCCTVVFVRRRGGRRRRGVGGRRMIDDMYSMCCSFPLPAHRGTPSWSTVILAVITRVPVCREGIRKQKTQSDCEASWFVCLFLVAAWGTGSRSLRLLHLTPCFDSVRLFYGCFLVIEAHGGRCFRTPCPIVVRSRSKC